MINHMSLSARRAWIEIPGHEYNIVHNRVALRKESVDRNKNHIFFRHHSLNVALRKESVDRNCLSRHLDGFHFGVALRKESVDRNISSMILTQRFCGRSPQGERG